MIFSFYELLDCIIMTLAVGFIFQDVFSVPKKVSDAADRDYDPLAKYKGQGKGSGFSSFSGFFSSDFGFAILVAAPAIIFHELSHKIVALSFGMEATFHAAYFWLGIAVLLKLLNFGFIFFVPAYVSISGIASPLEQVLTAFAGPAVNLLLFAIAWVVLGQPALVKRYRRYVPFLHLTKRINGFLFIFNMLPLPMFDGWKVFTGLFHIFF
jgi:Zn-dependent protease